MCESESICSDIPQLDGNTSLISEGDNKSNNCNNTQKRMKNSHRINNASIAHHLPVVSISNYRSFFPKLQSAKKDILERQVDINLGCEVWEGAENLKHKAEIEAMLELEGLKYFSTPRPRGKRGGGAAVIGNKT